MMEALASPGGLMGAGLLAALTAAASWMVTRWVTAGLNRRRVLDHPNERSSHSAPTPRGGGIGLLAVALPLIAAVFWLHRPAEAEVPAVVILTALLALMSWFDDLRGLPVGLRLSAHVAAAALALALMPEGLLVFQGALPLWLDRALAVLAWVWFINLYNFMDGLDGLAGVETVSICVGLFAVLLTAGAAAGPDGVALALAALVTAGAAAGFLVLNWQPARVFMGDVGAIALGYLLGWYLLTLAAWGYWQAALILPAYYLADATITIARRALAGEPVWLAHSQHFYQRAVKAGRSHAEVARFIAVGNVFLIVLAVLSTQTIGWVGTALCLGGAAGIVLVMLAWLAREPGRAAPGPMDLPR